MIQLDPLPHSLFETEPLAAARRLLGQLLVRRLNGDVLAGRIVEVEAYGGPDDTASHARHGSGGRAGGMWGTVGRAYVYLIYGMHTCLNVVAHGQAGVGAILIRALAPEHGIERMRELRKGAPPHLVASGPGRLCAALAIDRSFDGANLCDTGGALFLAAGPPVADDHITAGPRVGVVGRSGDIARAWRLYVTHDPNVSPGRRQR